jgi:hypothetical protein
MTPCHEIPTGYCIQASVVYYRQLRDTWTSTWRILGFARLVAYERTRQASILAFTPQSSLPSCVYGLTSLGRIFPSCSHLFRAHCGLGQNHSTTCVRL